MLPEYKKEPTTPVIEGRDSSSSSRSRATRIAQLVFYKGQKELALYSDDRHANENNRAERARGITQSVSARKSGEKTGRDCAAAPS